MSIPFSHTHTHTQHRNILILMTAGMSLLQSHWSTSSRLLLISLLLGLSAYQVDTILYLYMLFYTLSPYQVDGRAIPSRVNPLRALATHLA